jgi:hydroxysqualene dehydroxylase
VGGELRAAVIGAGYAGLAAAIELARAGCAVTVFETNRTPGGRARRVEYRGTLLDNGQHLLLGAYRETLALMREVGVPERALLRLPLTLVFPGRFRLRAPRLPAPLHLAAALATCEGLSWSDRFAAARFAMKIKTGDRLHVPDEGKRSLSPVETVEGLLREQPEAVRRFLWEPLCVSALNTPVAQADARVFANVLRDALFRARGDSDLLIPALDLSAIFPDAAVDWLGVRGAEIALGARVEDIVRGDNGWTVRTSAGPRAFDVVICAVAPYQVGTLTEEIHELAELRAQLAAMRHEPIATVYLQYAERLKLPFQMIGLTGGHVQWVFDREAISGTRGLLAAVISASGPHLALDGDVLGTLVHREIVAALGPHPSPMWTKTITEKRATFACTPDAPRPTNTTAAPGFFLAGDYTASPYPATLESAIASGLEAARLATRSPPTTADGERNPGRLRASA